MTQTDYIHQSEKSNWNPDHQSKALISLFWIAQAANDQDAMETARTALYDHGKALGIGIAVFAMNPEVVKVRAVQTHKDKEALQRISNGYQYLAKLYKENPVDRTQKVIKALSIIDNLDDFLNRPWSMT